MTASRSRTYESGLQPPDCVTGRILCDGEDRVVMADSELAGVLGYRPEELTGRSAIDLIAPQYRPAIVSAVHVLRRGTEPTAVVGSAFATSGGFTIPAQVVLSLMAGVEISSRPGLVCTVLIEPSAVIDQHHEQASAPGRVPPSYPTRSQEAATGHPGLPSWASHRNRPQRPEPGASELAGLVESAEAAAHAVQQLLEATQAAISVATSRQSGQAPLSGRWVRDAGPADIDTLTGLATRAALLGEMQSAADQGLDFAILLVDLDEFKAVNDTHGHDIGDDVLVHVADRLRACVRPDDLVVRFGGDEFVILCRASSAATTVAGRVVALMAPPIETACGPISITASVGISDGTIPLDSVTDLLARADSAMYWAKQQGKNRFFAYDAALHTRSVRESRTRQLLRTAITDRRIEVHYQPILTTDGADVIGVEAVARLVGDDGAKLLPADFLAVAERAGLIAAIDAAVLVEACRCIGTAMRAVGRPLAVSVNVSRRFIARPDLVEFVVGALANAGLPPAALMLELTESALIDAGTAAIARLTELRARGVQVALDNFGAGFASLSFLRDLPLSYVKVDRPYIVGMMTNQRDAAMIQAVTWLVDRLGLEWIAEGVETVDEWQAVRRFGPGLAQGYLFAEPLEETELLRRLRTGLGGGNGHRAADLLPV